MSNQIKNRFSQKKTAGDDRNLVLVDEDFQDADFEDRVWLFWQRHGKRTIAVGVTLFLAIIAAIVYVQVGKMRIAALQAEYAATETPEQKLAFAKANESEPIAGTAYFAVGTEFANDGKYAEASDAFANAARVFAGKEEFNAMQNRAVIASAAALARTGTPENLASAKESLKTLAGTPAADPLYRGQAMYELAVSAVAAGNLDEARLWINEMDRSLEPTNFWQARKRTLIAIEPKLATPN
ncbi:MAG: hypothetical protein IJX22_04010 [Opitutales bacterium]|nr:hypothetical protein [Opitutales bacterium]